MFQCVVFLYLLYRFLSRNYAIYGVFDDLDFSFSRPFLNYWPWVWAKYTTGQFIYSWLQRPDYSQLLVVQWIIVFSSLLGLLGIFPRLCARICALLFLHLTGMIQGLDAEIEGGTLLLVSLVILSFSPKVCFYTLGRRRESCSDVSFQWPLWLLFLFVGSFYTSSGLNKILDHGVTWIADLNLQNLAAWGLGESLFSSSRLREPWVSVHHLSVSMSIFGGTMTLIGELGFVSILFLPRYRLFFIITMAVLHTLVFLMAGINFLGSTFILFLCLDWGALARPLTVEVPKSWVSLRFSRFLYHQDWLGRLKFSTGQSLEEVVVTDRNGEAFVGLDAIDRIAVSVPLLYPLALFWRIPGIFLICNFIYYFYFNKPSGKSSGCTAGI